MRTWNLKPLSAGIQNKKWSIVFLKFSIPNRRRIETLPIFNLAANVFTHKEDDYTDKVLIPIWIKKMDSLGINKHRKI